MKSLKLWFLTALCLFLFVGCATAGQNADTTPEGETTASTTETTTQATEDQTEPPDTTVPADQIAPPVYPTRTVTALPESFTLDDLVSPYWEETLEWTDTIGNEYICNFSIPQIYPFSEDAIRVEAEIHQRMIPQVEYDFYMQAEGASASTYDICYKTYLNGNILSVLVWENTGIGVYDYTVYNLDVSTGKQLSGSDILSQCGISQSKYSATAQDAISKHFVSRYGEEGEFNYDRSFYREQLARSISAENISAAQLYLDVHGQLVMIVDIHALSGAEHYPTQIRLNELSPVFRLTASGNQVDSATLDIIANLFDDPNSIYSRAATSYYASPVSVHIGYLVYTGNTQEESVLTGQEKSFLMSTWLKGMVDEPSISKITSDEIDLIMQKYFGWRLDDTRKNGLDTEPYQDAVYRAATETYYLRPSGFRTLDIDIYDAYLQEDGTINVYYSFVGFYDHMQYYNLSDSPTPDYVMTLQPTEDGYTILSNWYN